jgi:hypothetical protein
MQEYQMDNEPLQSLLKSTSTIQKEEKLRLFFYILLKTTQQEMQSSHMHDLKENLHLEYVLRANVIFILKQFLVFGHE